MIRINGLFSLCEVLLASFFLPTYRNLEQARRSLWRTFYPSTIIHTSSVPYESIIDLYISEYCDRSDLHPKDAQNFNRIIPRFSWFQDEPGGG